jgi:hypothetical protein
VRNVSYKVLFENLFQGKAPLLPAYRALESLIQTHWPDVELVPTKTYISIEGKRVFGCATLTKTSIRVGLDLGDTPFGEYVQKAKGLGAMPNVTHMIEITDAGDANPTLLGYIRQAYARTHPQ